MKIEMKKLNRIKIAGSEEEEQMLIKDGYHRANPDPDNGKEADAGGSDTGAGQKEDSNAGQKADVGAEAGQKAEPEKDKSTDRKGAKTK